MDDKLRLEYSTRQNKQNILTCIDFSNFTTIHSNKTGVCL